MTIEHKYLSGAITEFKEHTNQHGQPVGIVEGYIATWDIDRGLDRFVKGAFEDSINRLKANKRNLRLKDHHFKTIGIFGFDSLKEDEKGVFGIGEINLNVQAGKEIYALVQQKAITDFSVGYSVLEKQNIDGIRLITKSEIWEGSLVDEPMNPNAIITDIKSIDVETVENWTPRDLEDFFKNHGLSKKAAKMLTANLKQNLETEQEKTEQEKKQSYDDVLLKIKSLIDKI